MKRNFLLLVICAGIARSQNAGVCNPSYRVDCGFIEESQCTQNNCCWNPYDSSKEGLPEGFPFCYHPWVQAKGYALGSVTETSTGFTAVLTLKDGTAVYGEDISPLQIEVSMETEQRLHVKISDPNNARWEVPFVVQTNSSTKAANTDYSFTYTANPFGFAVTRISNGEVLFNSTPTNNFNGLVFEDQYLELSTVLPQSASLYGLGERIGTMKLFPQTYTLWNADQGTPFNSNLYGSHPFYMDVRSDGSAHGVFLLSSNGMDAVLQDGSLTYKVIGGILDFYFFLGPDPESVVQQYEEVIGKPYFPPYWSLGFHQCRWGYHNISEVKTVVEKYAEAMIPLEAMWTDIDYMNKYMDFTFDPVRFPPAEMKQFTDQLHSNGQHYVVIIDPGISTTPGYFAFDNGTNLDLWIKNSTGQFFIGDVWPGLTTFPDWFHPEAFNYWQDMIQYFWSTQAEIDGLWIDMNEISNFCDGQCAKPSDKKNRQDQFDPNNPPYKINNRGNAQQPLDYKTISADAVHTIGLEYNTHNMFGMMEGWATQEALEAVRGKRALVISRSSFPGHGTHAGHWTGDQPSTWQDMAASIADIMNFNMYGIPLLGADICGFGGDTTEELCGRWIELGAFYPFCRDHNSIGQISQELYVWPAVANISRQVLGIRYSLLPYYYTLFYNANQFGGTVVRPLWFEWPEDSNARDVDMQFLVGSGVMVSPVLTQGATTVEAYFPNAVFYDIYTFMALQGAGANITLDAPWDFIPVHFVGGTVVPTQQPAYTTTETRANPFSIMVPFDSEGLSTGQLYLDDGNMIDPVGAGSYTLILYNASYDAVSGSGVFTAEVQKAGYQPAQTATLYGVQFLGVNQSTSPKFVNLNGEAVSFEFDPDAKTLSVVQLEISMLQTFKITFGNQ
eukprot:TRINITY_DN2179_c0_g1_i4.p2 TRINITY_DN2179_c0_g1~~TRINITY_DN2179_c0_g1_i4.p2  ORF type:complete len:897 (-),score=121.06 TRINITY_DN2179_c0_g1_i4:67-2757(-)